MFQTYQPLTPTASVPDLTCLLAISPHFGINLRQCRSKRGYVVVGTIKERSRSNGTTAYSAQILLTRAGAIVYRESKTFNNRAMAKGWIEKRERDLAKPAGIETAKIGKETLG